MYKLYNISHFLTTENSRSFLGRTSLALYGTLCYTPKDIDGRLMQYGFCSERRNRFYKGWLYEDSEDCIDYLVCHFRDCFIRDYPYAGRKGDGIGALAGQTDTYWQKNRGRSVEGSLEKFTKYGTIAFFAVALLLDMIW